MPSNVAGYLAPTTSPINDTSLEDVLTAAVVGITGIDGTLVRPRWQPEPPQQPAYDVDWCAMGITREDGDAFAFESFRPKSGDYEVQRDELLYALHSFYGPNSTGLCKRFRDGLAISQNRDALSASGVELVETQDPVAVPVLLHEHWVRRVDLMVVYRRRSVRSYQVLTINSATGELRTDLPSTTPLSVTNP